MRGGAGAPREEEGRAAGVEDVVRGVWSKKVGVADGSAEEKGVRPGVASARKLGQLALY